MSEQEAPENTEECVSTPPSAQAAPTGAEPAPAAPAAPDYSDPGRYKILANGAVYDLQRGRIAATPGGGTTAITQANTGAMHERRQQLALEAQIAARQGLGRSLSSITKRQSALAAWSHIVGQQAQLASDIDSGRASTEAARFVGSATGFIADTRRGGPETGGNMALLAFPAEVLGELMRDLVQQRANNEQE